MKKTKMPGRAGTRSGRDKMKGESNKMSNNHFITWPSRRQWRDAVVWLIEAVIGTGFVAGVIWLAGVLLKACGVL